MIYLSWANHSVSWENILEAQVLKDLKKIVGGDHSEVSEEQGL